MLTRLFRQIFLMLFFFLIPTFALYAEYKKMENSMPMSLIKIEAIIQKLENTKKTVADIARALGKVQAEQNREIIVHIATPPFSTVRVRDYHEVIKLNIEFIPGVWHLRDVTDNPDAWSIPPLMPDTGSKVVFRDWNWEHVSIGCTAGVEGDGVIGELVLQYLNCQISHF